MNYKLVEFYKKVVAIIVPQMITIPMSILYPNLLLIMCIAFFGTIFIRLLLDVIEPKLEEFLK